MYSFYKTQVRKPASDHHRGGSPGEECYFGNCAGRRRGGRLSVRRWRRGMQSRGVDVRPVVTPMKWMVRHSAGE